MMVVLRFAKAIKNNPKKSIAAAIALGYAGKWANGKYNAHIFRRVQCENAMKHGKETLHQFHSPKRITVFLNPAANNGKASKMYEKYAAPILHLAGFDVHVVKLQYEGEAKRLMSVLDDADMIICAGGDGTLSEIVTGLLRRPDELWKLLPIGVLPLGVSNTMCQRLFTEVNHKDQSQLVCRAATAIISNQTCPVDVMKVEGSSGKTVYALSDIRWGTYCDLQEKSKRYWSFIPFRDYLPFIFAPRKGDWKKARTFSLSYSEPADLPTDKAASPQTTPKSIDLVSVIFSPFLRWIYGKSENTEKAEIPVIEPLEEQEWTKCDSQSIEFVATANGHLNSATREKASINISLESDSVSFGDFVKKGPYTLKRIEHVPVNLSQNVEAGSFKLASIVGEDKQMISIDNDRYDAMDIDVTLMPDCLRLVCSNSQRPQAGP